MKLNKKNTISFIGAGKVGTALGMYFKENGFEIKGYYSRSFSSAEKAAAKTDSKPYRNIVETAESEIIWITTNDDSIVSVVEELAKINFSKEKIFIHASGVYSSDVLKPLAEKGHTVFSAAPLLSFSEAETAAKKLSEVYFVVEGSGSKSAEVNVFFQTLGNPVLNIAGEKKDIYHTAAAVCSNYLVTLLHCSFQLFEKAGISQEEAKNATLPLLESVLENIKTKESKDALTGPIKRGDKNTVKMHLKSLERELPEKLDCYKMLGKETMKMLGDYRLEEEF